MNKDNILEKTHDELFESVKSASTTKAKLDFFLDFFWKVVMNDIRHLESEVEELKRFMWKTMAILAGLFFLLQTLVAPVVVKYISKLLSI